MAPNTPGTFHTEGQDSESERGISEDGRVPGVTQGELRDIQGNNTDNEDWVLDVQRASNNDIEVYVKYRQQLYITLEWTDYMLWEAFKMDFKGFTIEMFEKVSNHYLRDLWLFLRTRGVWVNNDNNQPVVRYLADVLGEEEPTEWITEEINSHIKRYGPFLSKVINNQFNVKLTVINAPNTPQRRTITFQRYIINSVITYFTSSERANTPKRGPFSAILTSSTYTTYRNLVFRAGQQNVGVGIRFTEQGKKMEAPDQLSLLAIARAIGKQVMDIKKAYPEEDKWDGHNGDFGHKLKTFKKFCKSVGLPEEEVPKAFSVMLKGLVRSYISSEESDRVEQDNFGFDYNIIPREFITSKP
ncbi:hypothetical protein F5884DRAFT_746414 [Xylogone sp. PMI_703]|nr:hypothetical protein F5884DRAFT_746414 [Xylogone sp. PMI_703]